MRATGVAWNGIGVNAIGQVTGANLADARAALPNQTSPRARVLFWVRALRRYHGQPLLSDDQLAKTLNVVNPYQGWVSAGPFLVQWHGPRGTQHDVSVQLRATGHRLPKPLPGTMLTRRSAISLPTMARIHYSILSIPNNIRSNRITKVQQIPVTDLRWQIRPIIVRAGRGHPELRLAAWPQVSLSTPGLARFRGQPHSASWVDPAVRRVVLDAVTGEQLGPLTCYATSALAVRPCATTWKAARALANSISRLTIWTPAQLKSP